MKLILAICLILAIVSANDTCADHPILKRLKVFKESIKGDIPSEARESLDAAVTTFEENDSPAADTDMVRCDAFKDDDTCCTKEFTDLFPKFMRASFKSR